jgi:hypothetical protein
MSRKAFFGTLVLVLASLACSTLSVGTNPVTGSGKVASEVRNVPDFTSVELAGSADVNILLGDAQSVNVQTDDNILPLIGTKVVNGRLVIGTKPFTNITTSNGVVVTVAMRSLQRVTLSGSGNLRVGAMSGPSLLVELPGSGDITVDGTTEHVSVSVPGSGNVLCSELKAHVADVTLLGSGTVTVYADQNVNASLAGSGTIHYEGNPPQVTKNITGSGAITP